MKYLFILLMGFLFLGSSTVSLAADGTTTKQSQIVEDVGIESTLEAEIDFYIISKIAKENLLLTSAESNSSYISEPAAVVVNELIYTRLYKSDPGRYADILQTHKGKIYINASNINLNYNLVSWQTHEGKLYIS